MKSIPQLSFILLILLITILVAVTFYKPGTESNKSDLPKLSCGTVGSEPLFISKDIDAAIGKQIFLDNCVQCHIKNMRSDGFAPPLGGSINRFDNDTSKFKAYLNNSKEYVSLANDQHIIDLRQEYKSKFEHIHEFNDDEIHSLLLFIDPD